MLQLLLTLLVQLLLQLLLTLLLELLLRSLPRRPRLQLRLRAARARGMRMRTHGSCTNPCALRAARCCSCFASRFLSVLARCFLPPRGRRIL